jgi:transposase-like protein
MEKSKCGNRYSPEVRERAVRMVFEYQGEFDSQSAAIKLIALKIGCGLGTHRAWVRRAEKGAVLDHIETNSSEQAVPCNDAQSILDIRLHLCLNLARLCLRCLCD